jgi:hypothetical protein
LDRAEHFLESLAVRVRDQDQPRGQQRVHDREGAKQKYPPSRGRAGRLDRNTQDAQPGLAAAR